MKSIPCPKPERFCELLSGSSPTSEETELLATHLESCSACAKALQALPQMDSLLRLAQQVSSAARAQPPVPLLQQLKALGQRRTSTHDTLPAPEYTPFAIVSRLADLLGAPQVQGDLGTLGSYRLLQELGKGGMGVVYRAEDIELHRQVAIKVMRPELATDESARQRFREEARAMASLEHDHIVPVYVVGEQAGVPFLVMKLLRGESLHARLEAKAQLPLSEVLRIGIEITRGLEAAHKVGLIHRDIKPNNLWLEENGDRVKILDFGLARPLQRSEEFTRQGAVVGTPAYMSPEQALGEPVDPRCDLFSLGIVLYRLTTGQLPFSGKTDWEVQAAVAQGSPRPPHEVAPSVPLPLSFLIVRLLNKERDKRPSSAAEVGKLLTQLSLKLQQGKLTGQPSNSSPETQPTPEALTTVDQPKPRSRKRWLVVPVVLVLVGLSILAGQQILLRIRHKDGREEEIKLPPGSTVQIEIADDKKPVPPGPKLDPVRAAITEIVDLLTKHNRKDGRGKPSPLDALRRESLTLQQRQAIGDPAELVGVVGSSLPGINTIAMRPSLDGTTIGTMSANGELRSWEVLTGKELNRVQLSVKDLGNVVFGPGGLIVKTRGGTAENPEFTLWDARTGLRLLGPHKGFLPGISNDSRYVAAAVALDGPIRQWDLLTGREVIFPDKLPGNVRGFVQYLEDGQHVAVAVSVASGVEVRVWNPTRGTESREPLLKLQGRYRLLRVSPQDRLMMYPWIGETSNEILLTNSRKELIRLEGKDKLFHGGWSSDGKLFLGGTPGEILLWDAETGKLRHCIHLAPGTELNRCWFAPDGRHIFATGKQGPIYVFRLSDS